MSDQVMYPTCRVDVVHPNRPNASVLVGRGKTVRVEVFEENIEGPVQRIDEHGAIGMFVPEFLSRFVE